MNALFGQAPVVCDRPSERPPLLVTALMSERPCKLFSKTATPIREDREQRVEDIIREEDLVSGFVNS